MLALFFQSKYPKLYFCLLLCLPVALCNQHVKCFGTAIHLQPIWCLVLAAFLTLESCTSADIPKYTKHWPLAIKMHFPRQHPRPGSNYTYSQKYIVYISIYIYTYVCMYIYIHIYVNIYDYTLLCCIVLYSKRLYHITIFTFLHLHLCFYPLFMFFLYIVCDVWTSTLYCIMF